MDFPEPLKKHEKLHYHNKSSKKTRRCQGAKNNPTQKPTTGAIRGGRQDIQNSSKASRFFQKKILFEFVSKGPLSQKKAPKNNGFER